MKPVKRMSQKQFISKIQEAIRFKGCIIGSELIGIIVKYAPPQSFSIEQLLSMMYDSDAAPDIHRIEFKKSDGFDDIFYCNPIQKK